MSFSFYICFSFCERLFSNGTCDIFFFCTYDLRLLFIYVAIISGAASGARVEGGEKWGDVTCRGNQGRGNGDCRTCDDGSCIRDGDDYGNVVVGGLRKSDHRNGLVRFRRG